MPAKPAMINKVYYLLFKLPVYVNWIFCLWDFIHFIDNLCNDFVADLAVKKYQNLILGTRVKVEEPTLLNFYWSFDICILPTTPVFLWVFFCIALSPWQVLQALQRTRMCVTFVGDTFLVLHAYKNIGMLFIWAHKKLNVTIVANISYIDDLWFITKSLSMESFSVGHIGHL